MSPMDTPPKPAQSDRAFLKEALKLAEIRRGETAPNPSVGAVLVRNGSIIGTGFHWAAGEPHAEVKALEKFDEALGTTLYVTLEPCCHQGRTPPCTDLLIQKKIKRVVFGFLDPNPKVKGKGEQTLREKGIEVEHVQIPEMNDFYAPYAFWMRTGKTWLTGKLAVTQDGKVSKNPGKTLKITGEEADKYTHQRRKRADVILTSNQTVMIDNPRMTVRLEGSESHKPVWVLDTHLAFPSQCRLAERSQKITLLCGDTIEKKRIDDYKTRFGNVISLKTLQGRLNLSEVSVQAGKMGFHEAWVETGPHLFSGFISEQLFQEVILYRSNKVLGGESGQEGFLKSMEILFSGYQKKEEHLWGDDTMERWCLT